MTEAPPPDLPPPGRSARMPEAARRLHARTIRVTPPGDAAPPARMAQTRRRLLVTVGGFVALFGALATKLAFATVLMPDRPPPQLAQLHMPSLPPPEAAGGATDGVTDAPAHRADIVDRNGHILAVSVPGAAVYADPRDIFDPAAAARKLARALPGLDEATLRARLASHRQFVWIAREVSPRQEQAINALGIPGVDFRPAERRRYPLGDIAAHVLGGVDVDGRGVAGVEKWFDTRLSTDATPLRLSIDMRVQAVLQQELARAKDEFQAIGACGIVMDARTGEVVAMASLPGYDANDFGQATPDERFNRAVTGTYEPGSTFKLQTAAMGLDAGLIHVWNQFDTMHAIHVGRFTITDFEPSHHWLSLPEVLAYSSNIGASHIAMLVGATAQRAWLRRLGFFARSPIQLPESARPIVQPARSWGPATVMTVSFGNGIAVTPIQLVTGTAAVVDGGVWHPPTLLAPDPGQAPPGRVVMQPSTSGLMRRLMRLVVTQGTGTPAEVPGYLVGAKTGTSQKVGQHGYRHHLNISSMIAAFPINAPRYLVYAMLDAPHADATTHGFTTGGWTAGPVVARVIARTAPMLGVFPVSPDQLPALQQALALPLRPEVPPGERASPPDPLTVHAPAGAAAQRALHATAGPASAPEGGTRLN